MKYDKTASRRLKNPCCDFCQKTLNEAIVVGDLLFCNTKCRKQYEALKKSAPMAGEHLLARRAGYEHHGLGDDHGGVIHYSGFADGLTSGPVAKCSLEEFAKGRNIKVIPHKHRKFGIMESIHRAEKRLGEALYRLPSNNCEHFVNWCIEGRYRSAQVDRTASLIVSFGVVTFASIALYVFAVTGTAAVSTSLLLTFLHHVNYGSGKLLLLATISCLGGVCIATAMSYSFLRTDPWLPKIELCSRRIGKIAAFASAGISAFGGLAYMAHVAFNIVGHDVVENICATGIARYITIGVFAATTIPPIITSICGFLFYKISRRIMHHFANGKAQQP
jgi:hypothetical protein